MFYVYELPRQKSDRPINILDQSSNDLTFSAESVRNEVDLDAEIDFVDDTLLNTAPHNAIEQQLLRGDVIGLALMSGAILWSAMGAFG